VALSGTITGTCVCNNISGSNYTYELVWSATQNVSANTSTITVNARVKANSSYYSTQTNWTSIINGSTVGTFASTWVNSNGWTNLGSKTYTVNHNSDGTCSATISGSFSGTYNGANVLRSGSASATVTLNTIPRASSFTLNRSSATIGSDAITLNISRASSNFTHKIKVGWGGTWYLVGENIATSHSFTPPMSYCNSIPNATSGTATVKVETLNNGSWIGEASKTITLNVPSSVAPSVSIGVTANSALSGHDVAGKTTFTVKANSATGSYGSTIKSYSITGGGLNSTSSSATTGTLGAGSYKFTVKVTDSRGRTASASKDVTVHGYSKPSASFNVYRANSSGSAQNDGTYVYAKITTTITNIANANVNDKSYSIYWKNPSDTSWKTLKGWTTISDYSKSWNENLGDGWVNTQSYDVRIQIRDSYETITIDKSVSTLNCVLNIEQDGVGIGKIWEKGKLDVAGDIYTSGRFVNMSNNKKLITGTGSSDVYIHNSASGKYLQLKDDGALRYSDALIYHSGNVGGDSSNRWHETPPVIGADGVMEIGKYLDFHYTKNGGEDYSCRLCVDANSKNTVYMPLETGRLYNTGNHGCKQLASGAWYMFGSQSVGLSDTIWNQAHGIALVFSAYNPSSGQTYQYDWHTYFIPKTFFTDRESAEGYVLITTFLTNPTLTSVGTKHLRVYNNRITGDDRNTQTGTGSGITFKNNEWVLRYVYGV
jgi:phage structural protein